MNDKIGFLKIKNLIFSLLLGGVIGILLLSFFSYIEGPQEYFNEAQALTISSVTVATIAAPTNLTATAISSSQIDLSWSSTTEAVNYKVYRDDSFISSTALLIYSDTGLSPSTAYTYNVSAVNASGTESTKSSSASATTLAEEGEEEGGALPLPPPAPEVTSGSIIINNGDAYTNSLDAILALSAKKAFQMAMSENSDFSDAIWEEYQILKLWKLTKGDGEKTIYAKFRSPSGGVSRVISDSIILDTIPPVNVSNFEAIAGDSEIFLSWLNPQDEDFDGVRVMGSTIFYPSSPSEGILLYGGKRSSFQAIGLTNGVQYYYTVFSYDRAGNFSSGAVVSATPFREELPPPPPIPPSPVPPPPEIEKLTIEDFGFLQEDKEVPVDEEIRVRGKAGEPLAISIDYEKVPEVLKTIMVTLEKEGKSFSFLLRINQEKTKYEAVFLVPEEAGLYKLTLDILDYKNQALKKISGYLLVEKPEAPSPKISWFRRARFWLYLFLGIVIMIIGYIVWKIRMKKLEESY